MRKTGRCQGLERRLIGVAFRAGGLRDHAAVAKPAGEDGVLHDLVVGMRVDAQRLCAVRARLGLTFRKQAAGEAHPAEVRVGGQAVHRLIGAVLPPCAVDHHIGRVDARDECGIGGHAAVLRTQHAAEVLLDVCLCHGK